MSAIDPRRVPLIRAAADLRDGNIDEAVSNLHAAAVKASRKQGQAGMAAAIEKILERGWHVKMPVHYGYIKGTEGADGDHVDVFIGPHPEIERAYIINQRHVDGVKTDEHKVMLGFDSAEQAKAAYLGSFQGGFGERVFKSMTPAMTIDELKAKLPELSEPRQVTPAAVAPADETSKVEGQEAPNVNTGLPEQGQATLAGVAAAENEGSAGGGQVRVRDAGGGENGAGRGAKPDAGRVPAARSGGSGAEESHPARPGARGRRGAVGEARVGAPQQGLFDANAGSTERVAEQEPEAAPQPTNVPAANFKITGDVHLGQGSESEKFRDNLAAIRALKDLEREQRRATPEEQRALARYVGWGGLANAFENDGKFKPEWEARGRELADLLTKDELKAARRSTRNAHYTSETVVKALWDAVSRMGYKGGLVLESSMGTGNFIGLMPEAVGGQSRVIGVEYDSLTARIAQALYPQATVLHAGFQQVPLPEGEFDLNIGNPPFGSESLHFQHNPAVNRLSIHNQFFIAGMDALRPGGVQAMVVSRYLMDAQDSTARLMMAKRAKLVGAVRLPDTAFKENARTEVVTDILFFQRHSSSEQAYIDSVFAARSDKPHKDKRKESERQSLAEQIPDWVKTAEVADPLGGEKMVVNSYFAAHPEMIVGRLERSGTMREKGEVNVKLAKEENFEEKLRQAIANLPEGIMAQEPDAIQKAIARHKEMSDALRIALAGHDHGSMFFEEGTLVRVVERETENGGHELVKQPVTANTPWSRQLSLDDKGRWFREHPKLDAQGKPVKALNEEGKLTNRNVIERQTFERDADVPKTLRLGDAGLAKVRDLVEFRDLMRRQIELESSDAKKDEMEANRKKLASAYRRYTQNNGLLHDSANAALIGEMPDEGLILAAEVQYRPAISEAKAKKMGEKARTASATPAPILSERAVLPYEPPGKADSPADALAIALAEYGRVDMPRIAKLLGMSEEEAVKRLTEGDAPLVFRDPEEGVWKSRDEYLSGQVRRKLAAARSAGVEENVRALEAVQPQAWGADKITPILGSTWILKAKEIENEFGDWVFKDGDRRQARRHLQRQVQHPRAAPARRLAPHLPGKVPDDSSAAPAPENAIWRGIYERFMLLDHVVGAGKTFTAIAAPWSAAAWACRASP
jgi:predicted RNA methylase